MSPPGKEMYNRWNVPPVRVPERVVCVQIDGRTQIPRVTLQSSQSNKCCSLNNSGLDLHHGLACWENTTHGYDFRAGGHDPWWRDDWKKERWWIMRKKLFSGLERAGGGGWGTPPLVEYFQEKWLVFTSVMAHFPPTPGLWFPRNPNTFRLLGWSTINASLTALVMFGFQLHLQRVELLCTHQLYFRGSSWKHY